MTPTIFVEAFVKALTATLTFVLAGCATGELDRPFFLLKDNPYYAQCADEVHMPEQWYAVGIVQSEMLKMCIKTKTKAGG